MMKKNRGLWIATIMFFAAALLLAFDRFDSAMEKNDLKEEIKRQRREINHLSNLTSGVLALCKISVRDFEAVATANGQAITWHGDRASFGPFTVVKKEECVLTLSVIDGV